MTGVKKSLLIDDEYNNEASDRLSPIEKRHMASGLDENQMSISEARNQEKKDLPMTSNLP